MTPSTVSPFANALARVPFAVVATLTEFLTSRPCNCASTYALLAASVAPVGVATLVILALETSTVPVPLGSKTKLPFEFVVLIVLPFILTLSMSISVIPAIAVEEAPKAIEVEPTVTALFASLLFAIDPANMELSTEPLAIVNAPEFDAVASPDTEEKIYFLSLVNVDFLFVPPAPSSTIIKSASARSAPISVPPSISN